MVIITIALSLGMSLFSSPLLANTDNNRTENRDKYLNIMTVNKPQYDMVKKIIKEKNNVEYMFTNEKEINEFKYSEDVLKNISNMDLFIYTGTSFEPWSNSFIDELKKGNLGIINLARGIRLLNFENDGDNKENPYYFEGIEEYKIALYNVKAAVQDRDPQNRDYYEANYNEAIKIFEDSIKEYDEKIKLLSDYKFIKLNNFISW
jgi:ABC-type Zn uptake system ZnuABC Zn-binding protein ZnuA